MSVERANKLNGTPLTRICGVHIVQTVKTVRSLLAAQGDATFVSVAEKNHRHGKYCVRLWRIPKGKGKR
jgi:hypothetical protein